MASSDDLAEQQLFAELQASSQKVQRPAHTLPSRSAIQSANLLNAARLNRNITAVAASSSLSSHTPDDLTQSDPAGTKRMTRVGGAGKLKPVGFLREDLAKQSRREWARRGDTYDVAVSSPEKMAARPPAKAQRKPGKKIKLRVQHHVSPDAEAPAPSIPPETEEARRNVPPASPPASATDGNHVEEVPETPPGTSKSLPSESISRIGFLGESEQQTHLSKRKTRNQAPRTGRPSKSPRKGDPEDDTDITSQAKGNHPQVVINVRTRKTKHAETKPPLAEPAPVRTSGRRVDEKDRNTAQTRQGALHKVNNQGEHEDQEDPPQSAQKSPGKGPDLRKPQTHKRRKFKPMRPVKTMTGLDIQSDNEVYEAESSRLTKQTQQEPRPVEREQRQRRKGRKPTSFESVNDQAAVSAQEQEIQPRETVPVPQTSNLPQASRGIEDAGIASSGQNGGNSGVAATRQTRSKTKKKPSDPVSGHTQHSGRSPHGNSQHHRPQKHHNDARNPAEELLDELIMDEEEYFDLAATEADESVYSGDENVSDGEEIEDGEHGEHEGDSHLNHSAELSDIDIVFDFLDSAEHNGDCKTEDAMAVKEACQLALELLASPDSTLDQVSVATKHIQLMLSKYGDGSDAKKRKSLKVDAYAYVFRQAVCYLKSLFGWLSQKYRVFQSSLDAMRIIAPFFHTIVSLRDVVADWRISIPSRYKGVRLIKDVDMHLIIPLRRLSEAYIAALHDLEDEARKKRAYEELIQKRRDREQNEEEKRKMEALRIDRLNDWIELHVWRLRVEPDARRRQTLSMRQEYFNEKVAKWTDEGTEWREELDANGVRFSRVDLFKKRVVPPASAPSGDGDKEWTDEQMEALVYGLQQFAGPYVFKRIFECYCGVGQPLRRFGVPEITAKALDVKLRLLRTYEERDWNEVPKWIQKIPILP